MNTPTLEESLRSMPDRVDELASRDRKLGQAIEELNQRIVAMESRLEAHTPVPEARAET